MLLSLIHWNSSLSFLNGLIILPLSGGCLLTYYDVKSEMEKSLNSTLSRDSLMKRLFHQALTLNIEIINCFY